MGQIFSNIKRLKDKEELKKEIKSIGLNDILIWTAILLMFLAAYQNIDAGKNPCEYCMINHYQGFEHISCKEYIEITGGRGGFENITNNLTIQNENLTYNHT